MSQDCFLLLVFMMHQDLKTVCEKKKKKVFYTQIQHHYRHCKVRGVTVLQHNTAICSNPTELCKQTISCLGQELSLSSYLCHCSVSGSQQKHLMTISRSSYIRLNQWGERSCLKQFLQSQTHCTKALVIAHMIVTAPTASKVRAYQPQ